MPSPTELAAFRAEYATWRPHAERILRQVLTALDEYRLSLVDAGRTVDLVHSVKGRIKSEASAAEKASEHGHGSLDGIDDLVGVRVVTNTLAGRRAACRFLESLAERGLFAWVENDEKTYRTGYRSRHLVGHLLPSGWPALAVPPAWLARIGVEVQVRTLLEEAWGEIEHPLAYKTAARPGPEVQAGFVSLSERLHAANVFVEQLVRAVVRRPPGDDATAVPNDENRAFSIDVARVHGVAADRVAALQQAIDAGERARAAGDFGRAAALHRALLDEDTLAGELRLVLHCELGLDHLMHARALRAAEGPLGGEAIAALDGAEAEFARARALDPERRVLFIPSRLSTARSMRGDDAAALALAEEAERIFVAHGVPAYIRSRFYVGGLRARIGALHIAAWQHGDGAARARARELLARARADLEAAPSTDRHREAWMGEYLTALNNLAYFHHVDGDHAAAQQILSDIIERVDSAIFEHDPYFLDTRIAVELARLGDDPPVASLMRLDVWRSRLLDMLVDAGAPVAPEDVPGMLAHVEACEKRLVGRVRARFRLDETAASPVPLRRGRPSSSSG